MDWWFNAVHGGYSFDHLNGMRVGYKFTCLLLLTSLNMLTSNMFKAIKEMFQTATTPEALAQASSSLLLQLMNLNVFHGGESAAYSWLSEALEEQGFCLTNHEHYQQVLAAMTELLTPPNQQQGVGDVAESKLLLDKVMAHADRHFEIADEVRSSLWSDLYGRS